MEFSRQGYWSGLPFLASQNLSDWGIEHVFLVPLVLASRFLTTVPAGNSIKSFFLSLFPFPSYTRFLIQSLSSVASFLWLSIFNSHLSSTHLPRYWFFHWFFQTQLYVPFRIWGHGVLNVSYENNGFSPLSTVTQSVHFFFHFSLISFTLTQIHLNISTKHSFLL